MTTAWRCIVDDRQDGAVNMARDRAILHAVQAGSAPPTLRLYRWARPTVTLGRFQELDGVDLAVCDRCGIDVVRRPTGGRGVLHDDEVTYSMAAHVDHGVPRGVSASYRYFSSALAEAYSRLGVDAALARGSRRHSSSSACYLAATQADLSVGARKLSGSAQVWERDAVLQHGSFVIGRDAGVEARVFRLDSESARRLSDSTLTLAGAMGVRPSVADVSSAIQSAVQDMLGVVLVPGELSASELAYERDLLERGVSLGVTA